VTKSFLEDAPEGIKDGDFSLHFNNVRD